MMQFNDGDKELYEVDTEIDMALFDMQWKVSTLEDLLEGKFENEINQIRKALDVIGEQL